jgi:hypothetical protein
MEPGAFIPQAKELLDRIDIQVIKFDKEIEQTPVYDGQDAHIALLKDLFTERLDYSHVPEEGLKLAGTVMEIRVDPLPGLAFAAVTKNGDSGDNGSINILKNRSEEPGSLLYRQKITFHLKLGYVGAFTMAPGNCVRILAVSVTTGELFHIEVALTSQVPEAYGSNQVCKKPTYAITKQLSRHGHCYRHEDRAIFPPFAKWEGKKIVSDWTKINDAITGLFEDKISDLEPADIHKPAIGLPAVEPEELTGQVAKTVWWSCSRQDGMSILGNGSVAKIYWRNLKRPGSDLIYLTTGERVKFDKIDAPHGKTTFRWEIFGAEVIN